MSQKSAPLQDKPIDFQFLDTLELLQRRNDPLKSTGALETS